MPNYRIIYRPVDRPGGFGFDVELPLNFKEAVTGLEFDVERYETYGRRIVTVHGFDAAVYGTELFYGWWERGLVGSIRVPGNAAGLALEEEPYRSRGVLQYSSFNMDNSNQTSIALALLTKYLEDIRFKLMTEKVAEQD
jgi:hypothetical protein